MCPCHSTEADPAFNPATRDVDRVLELLEIQHTRPLTEDELAELQAIARKDMIRERRA